MTPTRPSGAAGDEHVKVAVLAGSLATALILRLRNRTYRRVHEIETADLDHDGVPDIYASDSSSKAEG